MSLWTSLSLAMGSDRQETLAQRQVTHPQSCPWLGDGTTPQEPLPHCADSLRVRQAWGPGFQEPSSAHGGPSASLSHSGEEPAVTRRHAGSEPMSRHTSGACTGAGAAPGAGPALPTAHLTQRRKEQPPAEGPRAPGLLSEPGANRGHRRGGAATRDVGSPGGWGGPPGWLLRWAPVALGSSPPLWALGLPGQVRGLGGGV